MTMPNCPPAAREPPFPLTSVASERVCRSLESAIRAHDRSMQELRAAIDGCVAELHGQGMLPEAVVITMRAFVQHAATLHPPPGHAPSRYAADGHMEQIIHWCVLAYYRCELPSDSDP